MFRALLAAAALIVLSACEKPAEPPAAANAATAPAPAAAKPTPYLDGPLAVSGDGVGPIVATTPFDPATIVGLFPKAEVRQEYLHFGDTVTPMINVFQNGVDMLQILKAESGGIGEIRLLGGAVAGPGGETLMQTWPELNFETGQCKVGEGRDVSAVVCHRPGVDNLAYVFGVRGYDGKAMPPADTLAKDGFLREMIWTPAAAT